MRTIPIRIKTYRYKRLFKVILCGVLPCIAGVTTLLSGCGGGGGEIKKLIDAPASIKSVTVEKEVLLVGEETVITVVASAPNNDAVKMTWSTTQGGALKKLGENRYRFMPVIPGEYPIKVEITDGKFKSSEQTVATIRCFGYDDTYGGVSGNVTIGAWSGSAASSGAAQSNILKSEIRLQPVSLRDYSRRVVFGNKGSRVTTCEGREFIDGELIIRLKPGVDERTFASAAGLSIKKLSPSGISLYAFDVSNAGNKTPAELTREKCAIVNEMPQVKYANLNNLAQTQSVNNTLQRAAGAVSETRIPDDMLYPAQWALEQLNLPYAWSLETGDESVVAAIIDSGIYSEHPDLAGRLTAGYDFIRVSGTACDGDGIDSNPEDSCGVNHGTHVAGIFGAAANNGIGVAGVDWHAKIMPVRVGGGTSQNYDILQAILFAAGLPNDSGTVPAAHARVINMSISLDINGVACPAEFDDAFERAYNAGAIAFVSAGNEGNGNAINPYALCSHVVAVGAVDHNGNATQYSNKGPGLDVMAPGGQSGDSFSDPWLILSACRDDSYKTSQTSGGYCYKYGTSMASPHAAGVAALMIGANPSITPLQIATIMEQTATDLGEPGTDTSYGAGLVNAYAAVYEAMKLGNPTIEGPEKPQLSVSPRSIHFGDADPVSRKAIISNVGIGDITISSISVRTASGGGWLSVDYEQNDNNVVLNISVNRAGLRTGTYKGYIDISSTGGDTTMEVTFETTVSAGISIPSYCANGQLRVGFVKSDNSFLYTQMLSVSSGEFKKYGLPKGSYEVSAATDCDGDGLYCEPGDACAWYDKNKPGEMFVTVSPQSLATININNFHNF